MPRMALRVLGTCRPFVAGNRAGGVRSSLPWRPWPHLYRAQGEKPAGCHQYSYLHGWSNRADLAHPGRARVSP